MNKFNRFYLITRDLHLYLGLFIAPFVLAFSLSVFFIVHSWLPNGKDRPSQRRVVPAVTLPADLGTLAGRARIEALRGVLSGIGVAGEFGFVRHNVKEQSLVIPVFVPGRETTVEIDLTTRAATITQRETGIWDALVALHKAPGQHLADIRMNWTPMRVWLWFADGTVYLLFFISVSGVYLWAVLRSERRIGLALIGAGAVSFFGIVYAVIH